MNQQRIYDDPSNADLTFHGHPVTAESVFIENCRILVPKRYIYSKCGYTFAWINRATDAHGNPVPKMYSRAIRPDEVHNPPSGAIRVSASDRCRCCGKP